MKRLCLDISILMMGLAFVLCLGAIPEGALPVLPLLMVMLGLACAIRLGCAYSAFLEEQAYMAKRQKRLRALRAKRQRAAHAAQVYAAQPVASAAQPKHGLYVA